MRRLGLSLCTLALMVQATLTAGAPAQDPPGKQPPKKKKNIQPDPKQPAPKGKEITATEPGTLKVKEGFRVELIYSVPKDTEGSWVSLCQDPKGRIYASDQYGGLFRITPPKIGGSAKDTKIEKVPADIGEAQGMTWAFDGLYVVVNSNKRQAGLYRVSDTDKDDQLDKVELLQAISGGGGEHGPHAVMMHPDGKRLTVVCGNQCKLVKFQESRPVPVWGEDHLLPRMPDGRGFMRGVLGPGGAIYHVTPDGKHWEVHCVGFRNEYDAAFHRNGDLFTYDADMEWDFNTPWYRPTRVNFAASGAEFGWRNGAGKYPAYYADSLPGICDIGPGSPTGVCFGYGAKFPAKYQDAFYICDWSYGKLYACHITPDGAGYKAVQEEFVTGTPLPLTDLIVNPADGALYFAIGGRRVQSGLYRVTYAGSESTAAVTTTNVDPKSESLRAQRVMLESFHGKANPAAIPAAWQYLGHSDRYLRFAARVALEHQPWANWKDKALAETNPTAAIHALLALCRCAAACPEHDKEKKHVGDPALRAKILESLARLDFAKLNGEQRLDLIRVYHILFNRFGKPTDAERSAWIAKYDPVFPTGNRFVDGELAQVFVYLAAPSAAAKTVKLMTEALTQEEQIEYARALRVLKNGWTPELRKTYFEWFIKAETFKGGNSFSGFVKNIKDDSVATLTESEKVALKPILDAKPKVQAATTTVINRPFVRKWTLDDLTPKLDKGLASGRDYDRGRKLFGATTCFGCHRYDNEGGATGPDLTGAAGRFNPRDLLESILDPSKEISDQYAAVEITLLDGRKVTGRIINLSGDGMTILTNMLDPSATVSVNRRNIEEQKVSKVSMMPNGLLDTLNEEEIFDLLAYVLSRGDRNAAFFRK